MKVSPSVSMPAREQHRRGFRSLDGKEDAVERRDDDVEILGELSQMRLVGGRIAGVGHDHEALRREPRDDQVVDDAGLVGQQERVFGLREFERTGLQAGRRGRAAPRRPGPDTSNSFMCEMSNRPACSRV